MVRMRLKLSILSLFALLFCTVASAQSVATGAKVRHIKPLSAKLTDGHYLYVGFVHSASEPCRLSTLHVCQTLKERADIDHLFLSREGQNLCQPWLQQLSADGVNVVLNASALFKYCGIDYAPFGLIVDHRYRVVWFGNPIVLNNQRIDKILSQWISQR